MCFLAKVCLPTRKKLKLLLTQLPQVHQKTQSFLGVFPGCTTLTEPFKKLKIERRTWQRGSKQHYSFTELKTRLTDNNLVLYFDSEKKTVATFDASPFGHGAVLTQDDSAGKPHTDVYASRNWC